MAVRTLMVRQAMAAMQSKKMTLFSELRVTLLIKTLRNIRIDERFTFSIPENLKSEVNI